MTDPPVASVWRTLLAAALEVVGSLPAAGYGTLAFRMGGGTVLMFRFAHRISNDIDLFIDDAQALGFLTPRLNETTARLTGEYEEAANTLKLVLPEGDIDFIVAGSVTREPAQERLDVDGTRILLEATAEILAKKVLYRAASFKPRDVFDVVTALARDPAAARKAIDATRTVHPVLLRRLASMRDADPTALLDDIDVTSSGRPYLDGMVDRLVDAVRGKT